jgi:hypothetical protein
VGDIIQVSSLAVSLSTGTLRINEHENYYDWNIHSTVGPPHCRDIIQSLSEHNKIDFKQRSILKVCKYR